METRSSRALKVKTEREELKEDGIKDDAWLNLPIPFKMEPDVADEKSTENFLDEVSAVVNANIAQIDEELVDINNKQLKEARLQMEALQRTLLGQSEKTKRIRVRPTDKSTVEDIPLENQENPENSVNEVLAQEANLECEEDHDDLPKCTVCKRIFNDEEQLKYHFSNRPHLGCCACPKTFRDNSQLNIHFRKHTGEKPFACKECDKRFSIQGNLNKHMRVHTGERRFECKICGRKFMQFAHLDDHIKTHTGERPFSCEDCGSAFKTKALLRKHKKNHDKKIIRTRSIPCRVCGKVLRSTTQLYGHMRLHTGDEDPFKCEVCGKVYKSLFYLQCHQKMQHKGIRPYKCSICDKAFAVSSQLRRHEGSHAGVKPFQCDICCRPFGVLQNLKRHLLTHTGDKPFACPTCGKTFLTYENMNRHTRIHTGEKPFSCEICGRKFAHRTTVKEHERTHTGDKPFGCSICSRRFSLNKALYKHMRVRHPEFNDTFQKVSDMPKQLRLAVAHNFDKDEYQEPEYIKSSDILSDVVKVEPSEQKEDVKPYKDIECIKEDPSQVGDMDIGPILIKQEEQTAVLDYKNCDEIYEEIDPELVDVKPILKQDIDIDL